MSISLPHGLDKHGQSNGPDIFARKLERIVAHTGSGLDALRNFRRAAHSQFHRRDPGAGYRNRQQGAIRRGMQIERPRGLVCATIAVVLGVIVRTKSRGFRNVSRRGRMPRFLYSPHAPLDPALVLLAQFGFADLKDLARPNSEFANSSRPAFSAKLGSRGKIQLRWYQGRMASRCNQRQSVLPLELMEATKPD